MKLDWQSLIGWQAATLGIALVILFFVKKVLDHFTSYDDDKEIEETQNCAYALLRVGQYVGIVIGMIGALSSAEYNLVTFFFEAILVAVVVLLGGYIMRHAVLNDRSDRKNVTTNFALRMLDFSISIATGIVAYGAFTGEGGGIGNSLLFMVLGLVALFIGLAVYRTFIDTRLYGRLIRDKNEAAGLSAGSWIIGFSIILMAAIKGPSQGLATDLAGFGISLVFGMALLIATSFFADWAFLPRSTIRQGLDRKNCAAITIVAGVNIATALLVAAAI